MLQIKDTLVSLDLIEQYFCCDLQACLGACCIEGDAGAPVTPAELDEIGRALPAVRHLLTPAARREIDENGLGYLDRDGDLVTTIVNGRDCAFTTYEKGGLCLCALEKGARQGLCPSCKPMSCSLYPVRLKELAGGITALNLHKWKICAPAFRLGKAKGLRAYQFLAPVLRRRFGDEWYEELALAAREWLAREQDCQEAAE